MKKNLFAFLMITALVGLAWCVTAAAAVSADVVTKTADSGGGTLTRDSKWEKTIDALNLLFNHLFVDETKTRMTKIEFIDNDEFLGYEYRFSIDANPMRIEFVRMSKDDIYHIFLLSEQVYHDGEFSHAATMDFFAVDIETRTIIAERDGAMPDDWNDEFPW